MNLGSLKEVSEMGGTPNFNFGEPPGLLTMVEGLKVTSSLEYLQSSGDCGEPFLNGDGCSRQHDRSDSLEVMLRQVHSRAISGLGVRSKGGPGGGEGEGLLQASASTLTYLESQILRSSYLTLPGGTYVRPVHHPKRNGGEFCGHLFPLLLLLHLGGGPNIGGSGGAGARIHSCEDVEGFYEHGGKEPRTAETVL